LNDDGTWYETPEPASGPPFPWPPAEGESVVTAFARTWKGASLHPRTFFAALPEHGSIGTVLVYYLPLGIAVAGATLFWAVSGGVGAGEREAILGRGETVTGLTPLTDFLLSPLMLVLSLFVSAAVTHVLLRALGGASRRYGFTTRIFAYAYSPQLLGVVPVLGSVAGFAWMVVVAVIGVREGHGTSTGRAAAAVLIPVFVVLLLVGAAAFVQLTGGVLEGH
jgi:hypothetical protein